MSVAPTSLQEEKAIVDALAQLGDKAKSSHTRANRVKVNAFRENLVEVATFIRDILGFDHCTNVTGTDFPKDKQLEISYQFGSIDRTEYRKIILTLGCRVSSADPKLPSLVQVFPSVNYHEREAAEMIGCTFDGHPNLTRFLLPEDWSDIPPMLKAYRLPGRLEEG